MRCSMSTVMALGFCRGLCYRGRKISSKGGVSEAGSGHSFSAGHRSQYGFPYPDDNIAMIRGDIVSINENRNTNTDSDHTEFGIGLSKSEFQPGGTGQTFYGDLIGQHSPACYRAIWHRRDRNTKYGM